MLFKTDHLTTEQAAAELGISLSSMRTLVSNLKIAPVSGSGPPTWRFSQESIERRKRAVVDAKFRQRPSQGQRKH